LLESALLMWTMGFLGSLHCIGMCGGLVSALCMSRPKIWWPGLVIYQFGRVTTYSLFGLVAGLFGAALGEIGGWPVLRALTVVAGLLMIIFGLNLAGWLPDPLRRVSTLVGERIGLAALARKLSQRASLSSWYVMGLANGLLPCGLVYAALGLALASASAGAAAVMMFSFGLGTFPAMLFAPALLRKLTPELRGGLLRMAGVILVLLGVSTMLRDGAMHGQHGAVHQEIMHESTMPGMAQHHM
jgi:sulfite exporter TauE/SafE